MRFVEPLRALARDDAARRSFWIVGVQVVGTFAGLAMQIFLLSRTSDAEYGKYVYVWSCVSFIALVGSLGLPTAALRIFPELARQPQRQRQFAWTAIMMTVAGCLALAVLLSVAALHPAFRETRQALLEGVWLAPLIGVIAMQGELLKAKAKPVHSFIPLLVVRPIGIIVAVMAAGAIVAATTSTTLLVVTYAVLTVIILLQAYWLRVRLAIPEFSRAAEIRSWLALSMPLLATGSFVLLINQADILVLGAFVDPAVVGTYGIVAFAAAFVLFPLHAVNGVFSPMVAAAHATGSQQTLADTCHKAAHLMFWPSLGAGLIVALGAPVALPMIGVTMSWAWIAATGLAVVHVGNAAMGAVGPLLSLAGQHRVSATYTTVVGLAAVVLQIIAISRWGVLGAVAATGLAVTVWKVGLVVIAWKRLRIDTTVLGFLRRRAMEAVPP